MRANLTVNGTSEQLNSGHYLRAFKRVGANYPAVVRVQRTTEICNARFVDLSGCGLHLPEAKHAGAQLSVIMELGQDSIVTSAEVVWSRLLDEST